MEGKTEREYKRILVTGAKGFIGKNLVAELKNRDPLRFLNTTWVQHLRSFPCTARNVILCSILQV